MCTALTPTCSDQMQNFTENLHQHFGQKTNKFSFEIIVDSLFLKIKLKPLIFLPKKFISKNNYLSSFKIKNEITHKIKSHFWECKFRPIRIFKVWMRIQVGGWVGGNCFSLKRIEYIELKIKMFCITYFLSRMRISFLLLFLDCMRKIKCEAVFA